MVLETTSVNIQHETLELHPHKAAFWAKRSTLIISDLHIGKVHHFRMAGIGVPPGAAEGNIKRLRELVEVYEPNRIIYTGDLFHSKENGEWITFQEFVSQCRQVQHILVRGNHDLQKEEELNGLGLEVYDEYNDGPFLFTHHPPKEEEQSERYTLCGHVHPAVRLSDGVSSVKLPCFWFGERVGVLPAFGAMTGTCIVELRAKDLVYGVLKGELYKLSRST